MSNGSIHVACVIFQYNTTIHAHTMNKRNYFFSLSFLLFILHLKTFLIHFAIFNTFRSSSMNQIKVAAWIYISFDWIFAMNDEQEKRREQFPLKYNIYLCIVNQWQGKWREWSVRWLAVLMAVLKYQYQYHHSHSVIIGCAVSCHSYLGFILHTVWYRKLDWIDDGYSRS